MLPTEREFPISSNGTARASGLAGEVRLFGSVTGLSGLEGHWLRAKHFTPAVLEQLAARIAESERDHTGELVVANILRAANA